MLTDAHTHYRKTGLITVYQTDVFSAIPDSGFFSAGIHPKDSHSWKAQLEQLEQLVQEERCLAIGECGLDSRYAVPMDVQEQAYTAQLQLAARFSKPVVLHCVNSWDRCRFLHSTYAPGQAFIYHGFAKASVIEQVLAYPQAVISVGQRLQTSRPLQEAVLRVPIERLLLETDDVEMDIAALYQLLSELKSLPLPALRGQLYANFKRIFGHVELA